MEDEILDRPESVEASPRLKRNAKIASWLIGGCFTFLVYWNTRVWFFRESNKIYLNFDRTSRLILLAMMLYYLACSYAIRRIVLSALPDDEFRSRYRRIVFFAVLPLLLLLVAVLVFIFVDARIFFSRF